MELVKQIERLYTWACNKADGNCMRCSFSIDDGSYPTHHYYCPFDDVITAAEERAKEKSNGLKN